MCSREKNMALHASSSWFLHCIPISLISNPTSCTLLAHSQTFCAVLSNKHLRAHPCPSNCLDSTQVYLLGFVLVWWTLADLINLSELVPCTPHALFTIWSPCSHFSTFPWLWVLTLAGPHIREEGGRSLQIPSMCQASWHHLLSGVLGKLLDPFSFLSHLWKIGMVTIF